MGEARQEGRDWVAVVGGREVYRGPSKLVAQGMAFDGPAVRRAVDSYSGTVERAGNSKAMKAQRKGER